MAAFGTGDFLFACASFHSQEHFALRAAEILVVLPVLLPQYELAGFGLRIRGQRDILLVLRDPLVLIVGEEPEQGVDIQAGSRKAQDGQADKA